MSNPEIIIPNPTINTDPMQDSSFHNPNIKMFIEDQLNYAKITPLTHPKIADLCSGAGAIAEMFISLGWDPRNITCIDIAKPQRSLVDGVNWEYWNLQRLGSSLIYGDPLPMEVLKYQHAFNVVVLLNGFILHEQVVCNFFVQEDGIVLGQPRNQQRIRVKNLIWNF